MATAGLAAGAINMGWRGQGWDGGDSEEREREEESNVLQQRARLFLPPGPGVSHVRVGNPAESLRAAVLLLLIVVHILCNLHTPFLVFHTVYGRAIVFMKLTLRPEWRIRPFQSFLGCIDIKTGVIVALAFAVSPVLQS